MTVSTRKAIGLLALWLAATAVVAGAAWSHAWTNRYDDCPLAYVASSGAVVRICVVDRVDVGPPGVPPITGAPV
jgi:hypothetical protein